MNSSSVNLNKNKGLMKSTLTLPNDGCKILSLGTVDKMQITSNLKRILFIYLMSVRMSTLSVVGVGVCFKERYTF